MRRISVKQWAATALAGAALLAASAGAADAGVPGAVRITDAPSAAPTSAVSMSSGSYVSGPVVGGDCNNCPPQSHCCPFGCLPGACCHGGLLSPLSYVHGALHSYIGITQSLREDNPMYRLPVHYQRYWPTYWYGQPGAVFAPTFPMVYMPTDTTQLGFYYQRVPYWQPRAGMLPGAPGAGFSAGGAVTIDGAAAGGTVIQSNSPPPAPPPLPPVEASAIGVPPAPAVY